MFGLIAKKNTALESGYNSYNTLKQHILNNMQNEKSPSGDECSPCYTPTEMLDLLYKSKEYDEFVINSLVIKKICNKIVLLKFLVIILVSLSLIGIFALMKLAIIGVVLSVIFTIIFAIVSKTGESYQQYYNKTMTQILNMAVSEYTISNKTHYSVIDKLFIHNHLNIHYDKYSTKYNCKFESKYEVGDDFDLELTDIVERTDKEGNKTTSEETVFDGFSIVSKNKQPHSVLNGSIIKIRDDQNMVSALLEDTVNSMVANKREFSFNSEKLNKHLDCKLARSLFTSDVDQKMFEVTKIITPSFEDKLLFLDERYNAFNMNLSDDEFSFTVNLKKDSYQKLKNGELFDFTSTYKKRRFNTDIFSDTNFEYDKLYPILERLFLRKYFRIIYNYQMDSNRFNSYEYEKANKYESEIRSIMDMPWKEFSQINEDYVKNLKEQINEKYNALTAKK